MIVRGQASQTFLAQDCNYLEIIIYQSICMLLVIKRIFYFNNVVFSLHRGPFFIVKLQLVS